MPDISSLERADNKTGFKLVQRKSKQALSIHILKQEVFIMDTLEALKLFKKSRTFAKAARELGLSERQLIRWTKEEHAISPAWKALLDQRLGLT